MITYIAVGVFVTCELVLCATTGPVTAIEVAAGAVVAVRIYAWLADRIYAWLCERRWP
jgi:hypothetical protein